MGFDPRESLAYMVGRGSLERHATLPYQVRALRLDKLREFGLYTRPTDKRAGQLWDCISEAPMSTEFAISRFLVPHLATGWALYMDCDVIVRENIHRLIELADNSKAVMVVKHQHTPDNLYKMDRQIQTFYKRKNWSSVMLINCDHPANKELTIEKINTLPGRDLHGFCWLTDDLIGELPIEWNYLVGHSECVSPKIVHFTDGCPNIEGYENVEYANEWNTQLDRVLP